MPLRSNSTEDGTLSIASARSAGRFVAPIVLVALVILVFMPALDAGLVDWDDDDLLFFNTRHRSLGFESLRWMFTTSFAGHYHPLTWLSYALDWGLWRLEWFGYHLTSVLLHAAAALVFYFVARRLFACATGRMNDIRSAPVVWSAAWAAGLFALHPLRVESATWLAARSGVLGGLFYIIAVGCYLRYAVESNRPGFRTGFRSSKRMFYAAAVASCALSLLAKATAITLPLVLLILDAYPLGRWARRRRKGDDINAPQDKTSDDALRAVTDDRLTTVQQHQPPTRIWLDKLPFFALSLIFVIRAMIARQEGGVLYSLAEHGIPARLAQACYGLAFYVWKTLCPTGLGPLYEIPLREVLFGPMLWVSACVVVTLLFVVLVWRRRFPALPAALSVYVITLFPVLGFVQSGPQLVADRYSYVPCLGFALLGGGSLLRLLRSDSVRRHPNKRAALVLACILVLVGLSRMTFRQSDHWLSALHLWSYGVKVSPDSPVANTNYADALVRIGFLDDAARHYDRALSLNPRDVVALDHYARILERMNQPEAAMDHYIRALRLDPTRRTACLSLARLLTIKGRPREAVVVLRDGAKRHPDALDIIECLARLLSTYPDEVVRNGEEAVKWAEQLNRAYGNGNPAALLTLATAYAESGRFHEAVTTAGRGLSLAKSQSNMRIASELERRLELFRAGKPYGYTK